MEPTAKRRAARSPSCFPGHTEVATENGRLSIGLAGCGVGWQTDRRSMRRDVALVLAGGKGSRLDPLTRDRAKPAVPFGGAYRIIDFALSNCINSGLRNILVMTQYKNASLDRHIQLGWRFLCRELDEYIDLLPPQQRLDENWYRGTADAVYQNIYSIERTRPRNVVILAGDHIYKMDYAEMIAAHMASNADLTIACLPVSIEEGRQFGVMSIDSEQQVVGFHEKPAEPQPLPGHPEQCLASMGIYVFRAEFLFNELCRDATLRESAHDFGKNIIPDVIHRNRVMAYPFRDKNGGEVAYWRDVGTLDAYYETSMDLVSVAPKLNLYDEAWPIRTFSPPLPPPKFVFAQTAGQEPRAGLALDSLVCGGAILSGGRAERTIVGPSVRLHSYSRVEDSVLCEGVQVGRHARVRRAIVDKGVRIPDYAQVGFDAELDASRGFTITEQGVTVIGKMSSFPPL